MFNARVNSWPTVAVTVKTAVGEASFTAILFTVMSLFLAVTLSIPPVAVKIVPVPSSLIVAVPVTAVPPVGVAVKVNVSPLSGVASLAICVRTSSPVVVPLPVSALSKAPV